MSRAATSVFVGGWSSVWGPGSSLYQSSQVVLPFWVRGAWALPVWIPGFPSYSCPMTAISAGKPGIESGAAGKPGIGPRNCGETWSRERSSSGLACVSGDRLREPAYRSRNGCANPHMKVGMGARTCIWRASRHFEPLGEGIHDTPRFWRTSRAATHGQGSGARVEQRRTGGASGARAGILSRSVRAFTTRRASGAQAGQWCAGRAAAHGRRIWRASRHFDPLGEGPARHAALLVHK
mgnify:CR=1 FL=1